MGRSIEHLWRTLKTGLWYSYFFVESAVLAFALPALLRLRGIEGEASELRVQRWIHRRFGSYMRATARAGIGTFEFIGTEILSAPGGRLVVANHPALFDIIVAVSQMPQADCIIARHSAERAVFRGITRVAGYIPNTGGPQVVEACADRLRRGRSVLMFPEGTRSPRGGLQPFQRGAAHIALAAGCDLVPVHISCDPPTLWKGQPWYQVPERRFHVTMRVLNPVSPKEIVPPGASRARAARIVTSALEEVFEKRLPRAGSE